MNSDLQSSESGEFAMPKCSLKSKPNLGILHLQLFCVFGFGVLMSSWVWTRDSLNSWKRFFYNLCAPSEKNASNLKKHQLIYKTFRKRHQIQQGNFSFSLNSAQDDPVGMNLDVPSMASGDISSSWIMALPQFLMRRNAVVPVGTFAQRQYSSVSDVSHQISLDSFNQPTLDSLSMQISEHDFSRHPRRKTRKERERLWKANRFGHWFTGNRRGSDTSLQSSQLASSIIAAKCMSRKVTKSTSTGDLGAPAFIPGAGIVVPPVILPQVPVPRNTIQRETTINHPFTHGITDQPMGTDSLRRLDWNVRSSLRSSAIGQSYTPTNTLQAGFLQSSTMIRPSLYGQGYNLTMPFQYMGASAMYGMYPNYSSSVDLNYAPYGCTLPFGGYQDVYQYQNGLLPMHPRADSASETEFLPIVMSDSEYTDTGFRSYDEAQLLTARLVQGLQAQAQVQAQQQQHAIEASQQPKPTLEPQTCAKTQFLKRMDSFNVKAAVKVTERPPSGKKSPHSEAPPPSPADSMQSLDMGDDDVFEEQPSSKTEPEETTVLQKLKSKFKRSNSLSKTYQPEAVELTTKRSCSALGLPMRNCNTPQKSIHKEKCLDEAELEGLIAGKDGNENVSR